MNPGDRSAAPALSRARAWALALTATLTMAVSYVDRQTLSAIAPSVQKGLGFDDEAYALLGMAFAAAYLVGAPIAGILVDRIGARRGLLGAVLIWSAVAALHALVPGFGALFTMRILLGLAEAPSFPAAAQTVHRALPPKDHARGFGVLFTGSSIGAAIAPLLAPWLAARWGFRAAFLGTAAVGMLWVPVWFSLAFSPAARAALDRSHAPSETPPQPLPREGLGAEEIGERSAERSGGRARGPAMGMRALVRHPAVLRSALIVLASAPLLTFVYQWGTKYLVHDHHLDQLAAGHLLWAPPLVFDIGAVTFGHLASRARARGAEGVPRSLVLVAAIAMIAGVAVPFAPTPELAVAALCAVTFGGGGLYALPMADATARLPPSVVSSTGGVLAASQSIAQIGTNLGLGAAVKHTGSYTLALVALSLWVAPLCVGWLLWRAPPAYREEDEPSAGRQPN